MPMARRYRSKRDVLPPLEAPPPAPPPARPPLLKRWFPGMHWLQQLERNQLIRQSKPKQ